MQGLCQKLLGSSIDFEVVVIGIEDFTSSETRENSVLLREMVVYLIDFVKNIR